MGEVLENGVYLPDEGERNAYNGLKGNWNTVDTVVAQVQALSSAGLIRKAVDELPTEDIETNVIYMLKAVKPNGDVYRIEYMYIDNHWDALGTSETTLDDYYTKAETDDLPAVKSGINATKVSNYDAHLANNDVHVTLANKQSWDGKQAALDANQTAAVNSGVNATKVTGYDTHVSDTDIHVTTGDKTAWNAKQDGLSQTQLAAVNSGVTSAKVTGYDSHVADTDVHVTTTDKAAWNGKQNALTQTQLDNIAAVPDKANSADLATVATTGDYGDLLNAPAIPTVNNATLTIQKNGADVATFTANASSNVTANLAIPVNTSDLNNDAGFLTQHNPVDNELSATSENALQNKVINTELNGKAPLVHTHAASDVTSGTFNIARIPNLDASKITSGTIDIARLPKGALERLVKVANQAARYALTTDDVQLGDTVQQLDTGVMYVVTDETKLDSADGYTEFTAGAASSVPWTGVTGKPADYTPASHSHGNITNDGKVGTTANLPLITGTGGVVQAGSFGTVANTFCEGNDSRLSDARTPVAHTHTKSDVTDLFNSANTWSAEQTIINNFHSVKETNYELGQSYPNGNHLSGLQIKDKNGVTVSLLDIVDRNYGNMEMRIRVQQKFDPNSNNRSTSGDILFNEMLLGITPTKTNYVRFNADLWGDNTYNLGTASNQWNNLYAKNYYYNGVAWGLDKENVWSKDNTFQAQSIYQVNSDPRYVFKSSILEIGVQPTNSCTATSYWFDKNSNELGFTRFVEYNNSTQTYEIRLSNKATNGALNPTGNAISTHIQLALTPDGVSKLNLNVNALRPVSNGLSDLGDSTHQWKSLNGVNPGALSIFNPSASYDPIDIPTSWNTSGTSWNTLSVSNLGDGWVCITYNNCSAGDYILVRFGGINGSKYPSLRFEAVKDSDNKYYIYALFPVAKAFSNIYLEMRINSNANLVLHHYIPAYGTV